MQKQELMVYYNDVLRQAQQKCMQQADAEDLAAETMLAALTCLHRGGQIEHPQTWLTHTLQHKHNDMLRRKYRTPVVVNLDALSECLADEDDDALDEEEAAAVRRELNYLARQTREVMLRYYYMGQSVARIAETMAIPAGTVKSRLSLGRENVKRGLEQMENKANRIPGRLFLTFSGQSGANLSPITLVEEDLIAQNLLAEAYEKPKTLPELATNLGIPTVYLEPIVDRLVSAELMARMPSDRVYTDFVVYQPEDHLSRFTAQKHFVTENFDRFWHVMANLLDEIATLPFVDAMSPHVRKKLERYVLLKLLQDFEYNAGEKTIKHYPARPDGGAWIAMGFYLPGGYDSTEYDAANEYMVQGGHRTTHTEGHPGVKSLTLYEFDTTLWDSPNRFGCCYREYFDHIHGLLWSVYRGLDPIESGVHSHLVECIPNFINLGLLAKANDRPTVDIPILSRAEYDELTAMLQHAKTALLDSLGEQYRRYLRGAALSLPQHLTSVPEYFRYAPAARYIVMSVIREAYTRGLHLHDVDYCCPPVVLCYEEA